MIAQQRRRSQPTTHQRRIRSGSSVLTLPHRRRNQPLGNHHHDDQDEEEDDEEDEQYERSLLRSSRDDTYLRLVPQLSSSSFVTRPISTSTSTSSAAITFSGQPTPAPPPFLTVVLMQLMQILPTFSQHLQHPTHTEAAQACARFEAGLLPVVASPLVRVPPSSSVSSSSTTLSSSPLSWKYWRFALDPNHHHNNNNNNSNNHPADPSAPWEREWESLVTPFLLLAGAEVLYARLEHLLDHHDPSSNSPPTTWNVTTRLLMELYQRIQQDLQHVQEVLCAPFLRIPSSSLLSSSSSSLPPPTNPPAMLLSVQQKYMAAATNLTHSIQALSVMLSVRCQLMQLQDDLFSDHRPPNTYEDEEEDVDDDTASTPVRPTLQEAATKVTMFLQTIENVRDGAMEDEPPPPPTATTTTTTIDARNVPRHTTQRKDDDGHDHLVDPSSFVVLPLLLHWIHELQAWKYCLETCAALEKCQYVTTNIPVSMFSLSLFTWLGFSQALVQKIRLPPPANCSFVLGGS
jgi:hypothetical protein